MSSPHVIVSAVHELGDKHIDDSEFKKAWQEIIPHLDRFKKEDHDYLDEPDKWRLASGEFRSKQALDLLDVHISYHSNSGVQRYVIEIQITDLLENHGGLTNLEGILEEINDTFDIDFTLEAYYWYDGVDRPGGRTQ